MLETIDQSNMYSDFFESDPIREHIDCLESDPIELDVQTKETKHSDYAAGLRHREERMGEKMMGGGESAICVGMSNMKATCGVP